MTLFNPDKKEKPTYRDLLEPAMKITDQEDADQYLKKYIAHVQSYLDRKPRTDGITAEQIAKVNLGFYATLYYDHETRERVERLFDCGIPLLRAHQKMLNRLLLLITPANVNDKD
ncbi:hypothetical protein DRH14_03030 [Candidatus Shapirobacteria bacterium]|nr:MAG: hypothetical protein DRH14_03030 [Candidatus Shapirobacteria bacterium]